MRFLNRIGARLGLARGEHVAWAFYDWANSAFFTTVVTAVFPIYYSKVVAAHLDPAAAAARFGLATTLALACAALLGPLLGAIADVRPVKKPLCAAAIVIGVAACAGLAATGPGDTTLAALLFGLANVAVYASFVLYDALLVHIARPDEVDRVSAAGYALGYVGGGGLLALNVLMILSPGRFGLADAATAMRAAFLSVAVWWFLFSLPLLFGVREPRLERRATVRGGLVAGTAAHLFGTLTELRRFRQAWRLLVAFLVYNDGVGTILRMATTYGASLGIETSAMITAILIVQFVGIPATFVFGVLADRFGAKRMVLIGLGVYAAITFIAYFMKTATHFFLLAAAVGLVQGGVQALSRSLFARMIPTARSGEFFGLFGVFEKFAGIAGPAIFTIAVQAAGSQRAAILSVLAFFVAGAALLWRVDVAAGFAAAHGDDSAASRMDVGGEARS